MDEATSPASYPFAASSDGDKYSEYKTPYSHDGGFSDSPAINNQGAPAGAVVQRRSANTRRWANTYTAPPVDPMLLLQSGESVIPRYWHLVSLDQMDPEMAAKIHNSNNPGIKDMVAALILSRESHRRKTESLPESPRGRPRRPAKRSEPPRERPRRLAKKSEKGTGSGSTSGSRPTTAAGASRQYTAARLLPAPLSQGDGRQYGLETNAEWMARALKVLSRSGEGSTDKAGSHLQQ